MLETEKTQNILGIAKKSKKRCPNDWTKEKMG
jgi:hypothetical protein